MTLHVTRVSLSTSLPHPPCLCTRRPQKSWMQVLTYYSSLIYSLITQAFRAGVASVAEDIIFRGFPAKVSALHTEMIRLLNNA